MSVRPSVRPSVTRVIHAIRFKISHGWNLQDWTMTDWKMTDWKMTGWEITDWKMTEEVAEVE